MMLIDGDASGALEDAERICREDESRLTSLGRRRLRKSRRRELLGQQRALEGPNSAS